MPRTFERGWRKPARCLALIALAAGATGCTTTTTRSAASPEAGAIAQAPAKRAWVVEDGGQVVGSVVRYEEDGAEGRFVYAVRNSWDQDLGLIDNLGRAYRNRMHDEPEWVGTGTIPDGVRQILRTGSTAKVREVPLDELARAAAEAE